MIKAARWETGEPLSLVPFAIASSRRDRGPWIQRLWLEISMMSTGDRFVVLLLASTVAPFGPATAEACFLYRVEEPIEMRKGGPMCPPVPE